jgi:hypothetical protein
MAYLAGCTILKDIDQLDVGFGDYIVTDCACTLIRLHNALGTLHA